MKKTRSFYGVLLALGLGSMSSPSLEGREGVDPEGAVDFLTAIRIPENLEPLTPSVVEPITVAIVDDGFRLTHRDLEPFIWENPREIPGNRVDDDGNGRVDDVQGWDVSDADRDVSVPTTREETFYHGTHLAGIVVQVARRVWGDHAPQHLRIIPVKCLSDEASRPQLVDGYLGLQYAIDAGADVILASWGVVAFPQHEKQILQSAEEAGCLIVSSAGNFPTGAPQFPAGFPSVLAVSGVEPSGKKVKRANFGGFVDLVAPATRISSASTRGDHAFELREGTSQAAAMVAAAAAVLIRQRPDLSIDEVIACLKNTAEPVDLLQPGDILYAGKLGAGKVNLSSALAYELDGDTKNGGNGSERRRHQGYLSLRGARKETATWTIRPWGEVEGVRLFSRQLPENAGSSRVKLFQGAVAEGQPFLDLGLAVLKPMEFVPGKEITIVFEPDPNQADLQFLLEYATAPIDQSGLYCSGTVEMTEEGVMADGSGEMTYSPQTSCKWHITAPPGKVIDISFLQFDTEANTDWLYFFNGAGTHEKIMAVYSGDKIPPRVTTWRNEVLVWFVTNETTQGEGWTAEVTFRDPPKEEPESEEPESELEPSK